jgi:hypothetical protein
MKSFTMIPDGLEVRGGGMNSAARKLIIAYLIRAFGFPGGQRWNDLTITQISKFVGLDHKNTSRHFNYIVDNWVDDFLPMVETVEDYRGMNYPGFYQFILATQRRAKTKVPKHLMCTKSVHTLPQVSTHISPKLGDYKNVRKDEDEETTDKNPSDSSIDFNPFGIREESTDSTGPRRDRTVRTE